MYDKLGKKIDIWISWLLQICHVQLEKKVYELQLKSEVKAGAQELLVEKYQFVVGDRLN